jgi:putative tryptophan/tyrosine transport system substrate-binding protein
MKNKIITLPLGAMLLALCFSASAQQPAKVSRIGYLTAATPSGMRPRTDAFRQGLSQLGYVEGKNIFIEWRYAEGKYDRLPGLADELVRLKVDVIIATGQDPVLAAKKATQTIPIIMTNVGDPVADGFVASLARPGGNITGLSTLSRELNGKRLELLKEAIPKISRVAFLWNTANTGAQIGLRETEIAARALGVQLQSVEVQAPNPDIKGAFQLALKGRATALIVNADALTNNHRAVIVDLAVKNRLPTMSTEQEYVLAGGLMSYSTNIPELYRRAAIYVDKILKGTKPADIPVEQPTKFELVINLKTAKQIGVTIPQWTLMKADKVIR